MCSPFLRVSRWPDRSSLDFFPMVPNLIFNSICRIVRTLKTLPFELATSKAIWPRSEATFLYFSETRDDDLLPSCGGRELMRMKVAVSDWYWLTTWFLTYFLVKGVIHHSTQETFFHTFNWTCELSLKSNGFLMYWEFWFLICLASPHTNCWSVERRSMSWKHVIHKLLQTRKVHSDGVKTRCEGLLVFDRNSYQMDRHTLSQPEVKQKVGVETGRSRTEMR